MGSIPVYITQYTDGNAGSTIVGVLMVLKLRIYDMYCAVATSDTVRICTLQQHNSNMASIGKTRMKCVGIKRFYSLTDSILSICTPDVPTCTTPVPTDCGAGIGRVSKRLLIPLFSEVDLVEQNATFLERSKVYLVSELIREEGERTYT